MFNESKLELRFMDHQPLYTQYNHLLIYLLKFGQHKVEKRAIKQLSLALRLKLRLKINMLKVYLKLTLH